jgi:hypothetical protein
VCVNNTADSIVTQLFKDYKFGASLKSNSYGAHQTKWSFRFIEDLIYRLFFKILNILRIPEKNIEHFRKFLSISFVNSAIIYLENQILSCNNITLIFPTTDYLSFRLIEKLIYFNHPKISKICLRITGVEKRGYFGVKNSEVRLFELSKIVRLTMSVGLETNIYREKFEFANDSFKNSLEWAPMPYVSRDSKSYHIKENYLYIGFLGAARKGKSFENIPRILEILADSQIRFHVLIQKPFFEWDGSSTTISELNNNFAAQITWLDAGSSRRDIEMTISTLDWVLLPNDLDQYKFAGSGIMFIAADLRIPVISHALLACSWDIETFHIGGTYRKFEDIKSIL